MYLCMSLCDLQLLMYNRLRLAYFKILLYSIVHLLLIVSNANSMEEVSNLNFFPVAYTVCAF